MTCGNEVLIFGSGVLKTTTGLVLLLKDFTVQLAPRNDSCEH